MWNPYYFVGMPLLANFQSAVFSYVNILFLFFSKPFAWSLGVMLSSLLTMLAMYVFLRHKKCAPISSLLGAIVFSLSGFEIAWMEYNVHGHTALFLPLLLLSIDKIFANKLRYLFLLPFFVAFQIFAGYIPVVIYSYLICFFYILWFYGIPQLRQKKIDKKTIYLAIFWFLGIMIAAIQILPGFELTKNSVRSIDQVVSASNASFLPLKNLITFFAPDFFGNPVTGNYFGSAYYDNFYLFIGTGTLILVFFTLLYLKKCKEVLFWWGTVVFSFILIFKNPIGLILEKLLFLSGGVAAKALFITDFSLALLAGFGFDLFLKEEAKKRKKIFISIILLFILFLFCLLSAMKLGQNYQTVAIRNLAIPFFGLFFSSVALLMMIKFPKVNLLRYLFLFIISSQLLYSAKKYLPFSKIELLFPKTPVIEYLQNQTKDSPPFRVELGKVIPQNFLMSYGIQTSSGYDALLPKRTAEFFSILQIKEIDRRLSRVWLIENYNSPLFPLLNTKYILVKKINKEGYFTPEGDSPFQFEPGKRFKKVFEDKTVMVYEDKLFYPRALLIYDFVIADTPTKMLSYLNSKIDFTKTVILEKPINISQTGTGIVELISDNPLKKVMRVETDKPGVLFIAENYFPGWKAYINGSDSEILRANYTFMALVVPSGKSEIDLIYQPKSFSLGARISGISFLGLLVMGIYLLWKNYKRESKVK